MANAEPREWIRHYGFKDQLIALEALGMTRSQEALKYLEDLYTPTIGREYSIDPGGRYSAFDPYDVIEVYTYPNARGQLGDALEFRADVMTTSSFKEDYEADLQSEVWSRLMEVKKTDAHRVIIEAIGSLKKNL